MLKASILPSVLITALSLFVLSGCQKSTESTPDDAPPPSELPDDFVAFYQQFHEDSAYQVQHIIFPLDGLPAMSDTLADPTNFKWRRENWSLHKPFHATSTSFEQDFVMFDEGLITERLYAPQGFGMQRRFAKLGEAWYLIYYAGMRPVEGGLRIED